MNKAATKFPVLKRLLITCLMTVMVAGTTMPVIAAQEETTFKGAAGTSATPLLEGTVYQNEYVIGAGDTLYVEDNRMGELSPDAKVLGDGSVSLPLVGKVFLAGLSTVQAKKLLNEKYAKYYTQPSIVLQVVNQRPVRVYVTGAVANPGVYVSGKNMAPESGSMADLGTFGSALYYRMYLADTLILAGGLNYNANVSDIVIRRTFPQPMTIHVNLWELLQNGSLIQDIPIRDQDVIEVSEVPQDQLVMNEQWEALAHTNLSDNSFKVSVVGAVNSPGSFTAKTDDTVLTAIAQAGGFSPMANHKTLYVLRTLTNGQVVKRELNMNDKALIGKKSFEQWARLMPNDVVFVDESGAKQAGKVTMGLVSRTIGAAMLPLFNRVLDFNQN